MVGQPAPDEMKMAKKSSTKARTVGSPESPTFMDAYHLLLRVLQAGRSGGKDIGGMGYSVKRDGSLVRYDIDDGHRREWDCTWDEFQVSAKDMSEAIDELLHHPDRPLNGDVEALEEQATKLREGLKDG